MLKFSITEEYQNIGIGRRIKVKVILYPRVSSKKQAEKGDSIEAQTNRLKEHSKDNNEEVVGIYTDAGKSASISEDKMTINFKNGKFIIGIDLSKRPAMRRLIEEAPSEKFEGIKFTKWDRFSRNSILSKILQIYFNRHNKILIPTDDSHDPLMVEIKGVLGEEEVRTMKQRVRTTRLLRFEKGVMAARAPIGYRLNDAKKIMEVDEWRAKMVREIFRMTSEGKGYREICKKMKIKPQTYYNIIRNKVYIGLIEFEGKIKKGTHPHLISLETFQKINPHFNMEELNLEEK